ncbi:MAG: O-antigen ligase family protein, partial [Candidatus Acidiferrum sp.]
GGRGISAADGADRLEAWANGLEMFKSAPLFGIGFNGFTDFHEITAHNSFVLCLAELGLLGSTLWMALLVTTTTNLNRIISGQRKRQSGRFFGLLELFETSYINNAGTLERDSTTLEGERARKVLPVRITAKEVESEPRIAPAHATIVPPHWVVAMRLALVSFMTTAWFLSRSYTTTMYLVLGLAAATIALQRRPGKSPDRGRWIFSTLSIEVVVIILIYGLVRLRH